MICFGLNSSRWLELWLGRVKVKLACAVKAKLSFTLFAKLVLL